MTRPGRTRTLAVCVAVLWLAAGVVWSQAIRDEPSLANAAQTLRPSAPPSSTAPARRFTAPTVVIGTGVGLDQAQVGAVVADIVNDPRSWNTDLGRFTVYLVQSRSVRIICGPPPLDACASGTTVWIDAERWTTLWPRWAGLGGTLAEQRAWFVNHELGHLLGLGHQECTAPGTPSPVMRPLMSILRGCTRNVWPAPAV